MKQQSHLIKPVLDAEYPTIAYGKGIFLYDTTNKEYIDGSSGAITASIGHAVPEIIKAMTKQANKVSFIYRSQFTSDSAEKLATKLSEITPGNLQWTFFVNSGSEATETALKIAIQHWQEKGQATKSKIISRHMSYHGITLGALSMSGHVARRERFVPLLEDFPTVPAPYCYRCPFETSYPNCSLQCATELEKAINRIGKKHIAAFIAEPIVGAAGGAIVPPEDYYQKIKTICEQNEILFIADEVMTGIGRTGKWLAIEHWGVVPDIVALGKGLTAGYTPMAATIVTDYVMEPILHGSKIVMSGHTFSANPQSAATSLAVLHYMEKHKLLDRAEKKGKFLKKKLIKLANKFSFIGDIRGEGLLLGIEFVKDKHTKEPIKLANLVIQEAMKAGLLVYPASAGDEGTTGDAILIAPPLIITNEEIDELIRRLQQAFIQVEKQGDVS